MGGGSPKGTIGFMGGTMGGDMTSMGGDIDKSAKMCHHFAFLVYFLKISKKFCYFPQIWCRKSKNLQNLQNFRRFAPTCGWTENFHGGGSPPTERSFSGGGF